MCPPDFYGIEYEINPWMNRARPSDRGRAVEQWTALKALLESLGVRISLVEPRRGLPDLVFTANAGLVYRDVAVLSRFRPEQRRGEEPIYEQWFLERGFEVRKLPVGVYFEGAGDALFCGDTLLAGYRIRSHATGLQRIGASLGCRVIPMELVDPYYYHLDTCFCPLSADTAIYYPPALDSYARAALAEIVPNLISVEENEARRFACNAVLVGKTVITNTGCPRLAHVLAERGFLPRETPLDEFVKAGGSAKCLTLRLDGEEAAAWREKNPNPTRQ
jgi:N-dimethylarginine dimethylaminohydrolase